MKMMSTRRETRIIYFVVAVAVIAVAFLLLGGGPWIKGMGHGNGSMVTTNLHWGQILISLGLGFLLGWLASRRKW
jgi:TRAP-type C4-dicarboxylate transport system permease small subunit